MVLSFWTKAWAWIKKKWEIVLGFVVGLLTLLTVMMRSRQQKEVLEAANKAHEKENKINDKARKDLVDGLTDIAESKDKKIEEANKLADEDAKKLADEKKDFVDNASKSDDLARKIADHLNAELIDADDE